MESEGFAIIINETMPAARPTGFLPTSDFYPFGWRSAHAPKYREKNHSAASTATSITSTAA